MQTKMCSKCKQEKSLIDFGKDGERLRSHCKVCLKQRREKYKIENLEKIKARAHEYNLQYNINNRFRIREQKIKYLSIPANKIKHLLCKAKFRANKIGLDFDKELLEILPNNLPDVCECCGQDIDYSSGHGLKWGNGPSLDRVNNDEGYTIKNTKIICRKCNCTKNSLTIAKLNLFNNYINKNNQYINSDFLLTIQ